MRVDRGSVVYVVFDGGCGFCHRSALFVARHDVDRQFLLVSSSSGLGVGLLHDEKTKAWAAHSIVVVDGNQCYTRGEALLFILRRLPQWRGTARLLGSLPLCWVDIGYAMVSRVRRYLNFRRSCAIPSEALRERFVY